MKVALIGAGSRSFGTGQIIDVFLSKDLKGKKLTLSLVDENEASLERAFSLALNIKEHTGSAFNIESTTDRRSALVDADYVITAVAQRRMELWEQDFRIPLAYGFKHCIGENAGPGALFHALRSLELIIPICRDMEELCPDAFLLNFTNPEARVLHAICHLTKIKAVGLCHGVFYILNLLSRMFQRPIEEFEVTSAGVNHFYCLLQLKDKKTGHDLLPAALKIVVEDHTLECPPLFRKIAEVFGIISFPSDDHIGEFLSYGAEFTGLKWPYGLESRSLKNKEDEDADLLSEYLTGKRKIDDHLLKPSGELAIPIICDMECNRKNKRPAVNVMNQEHYIENLPKNGIVEVPAMVDGAGIHPLKVGSIPESFAAIIRTQMSINELVTEAYRTQSRKLLLQALLLDPLVNSVSASERLLEEMLVVQSNFLPEFKNV